MPLASTRRQFLGSLGALAPAAQRKRLPNILFFFPDQHRFDWVGGNPDLPVHMPNVDFLARNGVRFTRAIVSSPLCAPSRASLACGREYARCGVRNNGQDYPLEQPTFYQMLRDSGHQVMGCGKFDLHKATHDWGLDGRRFLPEWGFSDGIDNAGKFDAIQSGALEPRDPYMAYLHRRGLAAMHVDDFKRRMQQNSYLNTEPTLLPEEAYCDNWVASNGLELLRAVPSGRPWFLQVNFTGPHNPVDITRRMERLCRRRMFPHPADAEQYSPERHTAIRQNYTAMVENIDRWLGIYLDEVRRRGELDNTLLVYSSDHGEMLGDHERWGKSVPYQPSVGVPLYISGPGVERGIVSDALVSHFDLAATFLDLAGFTKARDMDARSLRPLLEGKARTHREFVRSGLDRWRMVYDGRYKLIRGFETERAPSRGKGRQGIPAESKMILFDLKIDPEETKNLAREGPDQVERLSKLLS
ncbi:MAG: sulfatase-like hydrolase/transferase [Acidobacteria bacterium]|nr:sulfatase-like hydrolase/transferase [Acidobacteriota bacterium]